MKTKTIIENGIKYKVKEDYYDNGNIECQYWYKNGLMHRDNDKPAYIGYYNNGKISYQVWYKNDLKHRDNDKPAYIGYYNNGNINYQYWYKNGLMHRDNDKPAYIIYYDSGNIRYQYWYKNGLMHRDNDKPAYIGYYNNGKINYQVWYKNDLMHRDNDKPAYIIYFDNGKINYQYWYKNDLKHRDNDKPAYIIYFDNGKISYQVWYKYGVKVTKQFVKNKEWEKMSIKQILSESNAQKRMMLIKLVGIEKIIKEGKPKILEEIKGIELYNKYPIGDYYQQGDVLVKSEPIAKINFNDIDEKTKVRLSKIIYKVIEIEGLRYLYMTNPSHNELIHIEGLKKDIDTVFKAICFRNKCKYLPMALS